MAEKIKFGGTEHQAAYDASKAGQLAVHKALLALFEEMKLIGGDPATVRLIAFGAMEPIARVFTSMAYIDEFSRHQDELFIIAVFRGWLRKTGGVPIEDDGSAVRPAPPHPKPERYDA